MSTKTPARRRLRAEDRRAIIEKAATELFAERGYLGTSMDEVARRSGVSAAVLYDHFASKVDLHESLLQRHFAELRAVWAAQVPVEGPFAAALERAFDAWFAYVQRHPYAWRMLFRDTSGDPEVERRHKEVMVRSRDALLPLFARALGKQGFRPEDESELVMRWEALRGVLQSLALWWYQQQEIPRERVVAAAMDSFWLGFERVKDGERWPD